MSTTDDTPKTITEHENQQIDRANATTATPVVFVHGLWLLPSSWERWATFFEEAGFVALRAGLARRPGDRRGGQGAPRGVRGQGHRATSPITRSRSSAGWSESRS